LLQELRSGSKKVVALAEELSFRKANIGLIEAANLPTVFLDAGSTNFWDRCRRQSEKQGMERPFARKRGRVPGALRDSGGSIT